MGGAPMVRRAPHARRAARRRSQSAGVGRACMPAPAHTQTAHRAPRTTHAPCAWAARDTGAGTVSMRGGACPDAPPQAPQEGGLSLFLDYSGAVSNVLAQACAGVHVPAASVPLCLLALRYRSRTRKPHPTLELVLLQGSGGAPDRRGPVDAPPARQGQAECRHVTGRVLPLMVAMWRQHCLTWPRFACLPAGQRSHGCTPCGRLRAARRGGRSTGSPAGASGGSA